jgi:signal peptidase I
MSRKGAKAGMRLRLFCKSWVGMTVIILFIGFSFRSAVADWNDVSTGSMKPTILEGDRIFVNRIVYDLKIPFTTFHLASWDDPDRGDIVVLRSPADGSRLVKRVIGMPGDRIVMRANRLILNDEPVEYSPPGEGTLEMIPEELRDGVPIFSEDLPGRDHPVMFLPLYPARDSFGPIEVPADNYFVMGDNRNNSADSRYFGFVHRGDILGQATAVIASLDIRNAFRPRWDRFFTSLP